MKMVLAGLCAATVAAMCGCSSVPSCTTGMCGPGGPDCQPGTSLWTQYCSGGDVTYACDDGRMSLFGLLFGSRCEAGCCGSAMGGCGDGGMCIGGDCGGCASGGCGVGLAGNRSGFSPVAGLGGGLVGCAGSGCDGRCGGRCPIAASLATGAAGTVGAAVRHVVHTPQRIGNHCANGFQGLAPGPTQGAVVYPYYTTRGPRDFLMANPPTIGP